MLTLDRGAWCAMVHGSQRVGHDSNLNNSKRSSETENVRAATLKAFN